MTTKSNQRDNYWHLLDASEKALGAGDFPVAEARFHEAAASRESSPGRVFFTEKLGDGLKRLVKRGQPVGEVSSVPPAGRWAKRSADLFARFVAQGEVVVREGLRLAELRPEDDAEHNQPILETALFLVARSRLFQEEPSSAVPLLKGVFRTARRTTRPFDVGLVRHDLPLTEEDRLWLAHRGGELLEVFLEHRRLEMGSAAAEEWARVILQLLQPRYFGSTSRLEEERSWLEAVSADRLLGKAHESVDLYRTYLQMNPEPGPRADESRVRLLELLGNTDGIHFPVPRYGEALGALQSAGLARESLLANRYQAALACIEYRRPEPERVMDVSPAWASLAVEADGRVAAVFWWGAEPRDVAYWYPGNDSGPMESFLEPCTGRLVAADDAVNAGILAAWHDRPGPWTVRDFLAALMESRLPASGLDGETLMGFGLAETGFWRSGWDARVGHPDLEPPRSSSLPETWREGPASHALLGGLAWLAVRSRIGEGDPMLRAGIGEMARRGDQASAFLYDFLCLDHSQGHALDSSFQAWTLPLLWTRPDPYGWSSGSATAASGLSNAEGGVRPDLVRNDLAIVSTGDPGAVLSAWGDGQQKWRVVLDRLDRLESLSRVAGSVIGPVTLIPCGGTVHSLSAALDLLEDQLQGNRGDHDELIPLFHWARLVETHNGDLLDFRQVRPRPGGHFPLYDRYAELVNGLPREAPRLDEGSGQETWAGQFSQRVRKAGLVGGTVDQLVTEPHELDSMWGVFEGSDASWIFLDSAAVHWTLFKQARMDIAYLHTLLHSRGRRHLSLLTGSVWMRPRLEDLLSRWLGVYGTSYCLSLTDQRPPLLRLANRGVHPEAEYLLADALAGQITWIDRAFTEGGGGSILLPAAGASAAFWGSIQTGEVSLAGRGWTFLESVSGMDDASGEAKMLAVPVLASLDPETTSPAVHDNRAEWSEADEQRLRNSEWQGQLCALEIGSLLAGPWATVSILDTRWWRLVPAEGPPDNDSGRPWCGERASESATQGAARVFDLPGGGGRENQRVDSRIRTVVDGWLNRQYRPLSLGGAGGGQVLASGSEYHGGVHLVLGDDPDFWPRVIRDTAEAWERGQLDSWVLMVADRVPEGAAQLVAASGRAGLSVWMGEASAALDPAPLVWVEPEDFLDPALRRYLEDHRPGTIVVQDVDDWLPGPERDAQETALAIRALLDCAAGTLILKGRILPESWQAFLAETCKAKIHGHSLAEPDAEAAESIGAVADICLDAGQARSPGEAARRLRSLLANLRDLAAVPQAGMVSGSEGDIQSPAENQLLPLAWLGCLAGLPGHLVADSTRILRWAARLSGDPLSWAGAHGVVGSRYGGGHSLLIPRRFADLEKDLESLETNLGILLPLWLGTGLPGQLGWVDLETPPADIEAADLALLDSFLMAVSSSEAMDTGLVYACPRGVIGSTQRMIGCTGPSEDVLMALDRQLRIFKARLADVMSSAQETGEGFLVETGLLALRADEEAFMGLGVALGYWRWLGPPSEGTLHLVDLLTLADSPTAKSRTAGWTLLQAELAGRYPGGQPPRITDGEAAGAVPRSGGLGLGGLRSLLTGGMESSDDLDPVVERVARLAGGEGDASVLVLKGFLGSGRHEVLARGLLRVRHQEADLGEVTIFCPDEAVGAMVSRELLARGLDGPLDIRVPAGPSSLPAGLQGTVAKADPSQSLVVMCEVQRFAAETRYRIAQAARGRRLLMTVDPVSVQDSWENLFLTTPRTDDIVTLETQRRVARRLWAEVKLLLPVAQQGKGGSRSREKGLLVTDYAANLDQCLARVGHEYQEGRIKTPLRLTAPMPADLEYLGSSIRARGWLAVLESRLEALLLPGPRELLAAVVDLLTENAGAPSTADNEDTHEEAGTTVAEPTWLLPRLLGVDSRNDWEQWRIKTPVATDITLVEFVALIAPTPWANTFLARPENRQRVQRLLDTWGDETLVSLAAIPLWDAWRSIMRADLGLGGPERSRPLVVLTSATRPLGSRVAGGAYLCLGTEPDLQHYEALGRIDDSLLVLYQEKSPLPGQAMD